MPVTDWSTTPASNSSSPPYGAPEGMNPAGVNDVMRQIMADAAVEFQANAVKYLSNVTGSNTITAQMVPALDAYHRGMFIVFTPTANNTGAATLNINTLGALDIVKESGTALVSGDLVSGVPAFLVLDHGNDDWFLLNPQTTTAAKTNQANTFTNTQTFLGGVLPVVIGNPSAPENNRRWRFGVSTVDGTMGIYPETDAGATSGTAIAFRRSGNTITETQLPASTTISGVNLRDAGIINSGTFANARIAQSNVTQHQAALSLSASQIASGAFANARISQASVTQHQAALSINGPQLVTSVVASSGSVTISSAHREAVIRISGTGTVTINNNHGFSVGQSFAVVRVGSGNVGFNAVGNQVFQSPGNRLNIPEQYGTAVMTYVATNTWSLTGV